MGKITERNTDASTAERWGSVTLFPTDDVVVGSFATWTITFTVGAYAMDVGGGLKIGTRRQADFGTPQFEDPAGDNFASVTCSRPDSAFETFFDPRGHKRPFNAVLVVRLAQGPLYPGDTITVVLGDRSGGSRGLAVQSFPESACDFAIFVDPLSSGEYKRVYSQSPTFRVLSGPSEHLTLVAPTIVQSGAPFRVQVRGNDRFGNPTAAEADDLILDADPPIEISISERDGRAKWIDGVTLKKTGTRRLQIKQSETILAASNPIIVQETDSHTLCWGDTQAQTASTVGIGTPEEYFAYARDLAAIDFTTHQGNDFILSDADLDEVRAAAKKHHAPGKFVPFFGWEWSGPTGTGGDRNVLFLDDDGPIYRSSHWQLWPEEIADDATDSECVSARDLQDRMRAYVAETGRKVIMVPHIGGRRSDFDAQDIEIEPVFEICSNHGIFEWRLHEFLRSGVKVGIVGASDDHTCRPGLAYPSTPEMTILGGLAAVYATEKTRQGIYDGLMARHCYGTTGARIFLDVAVDGHPMGAAVSTSTPPRITAQVLGTAPLDEICLFDGERVVHRQQPNPSARDPQRLRILWSGARSQDRGRFLSWQGGLELDKGRIVDAQPINMFAPKYGITDRNPHGVHWRSVTAGQEEGVLVKLDAPDDARISFAAGPARFAFSLREVRADDILRSFGGVEQMVRATTLHCEGDIIDGALDAVDDGWTPGPHAYFLRVIQRDGHRAWSSPVYVDFDRN